MTNVFILPSKIMNCSLFNFLKIVEEIIAAWLLPSPGRSEQIGDTKIVAKVGLIRVDFEIMIFFIFCLGGVEFVFIEFIIVGIPKSPVNRGSNGFSKFKLKVASPKNPANKKIIIEFILFLEFDTKKIEIQIKIKLIILSIAG